MKSVFNSKEVLGYYYTPIAGQTAHFFPGIASEKQARDYRWGHPIDSYYGRYILETKFDTERMSNEYKDRVNIILTLYKDMTIRETDLGRFKGGQYAPFLKLDSCHYLKDFYQDTAELTIDNLIIEAEKKKIINSAEYKKFITSELVNAVYGEITNYKGEDGINCFTVKKEKGFFELIVYEFSGGSDYGSYSLSLCKNTFRALTPLEAEYLSVWAAITFPEKFGLVLAVFDKIEWPLVNICAVIEAKPIEQIERERTRQEKIKMEKDKRSPIPRDIY